MQIDLQSPLRRLAFDSVVLAVLGVYLLLAGRAFWAGHLATQPGVREIETAIRLEPSNSEYRAVLARNQALSVATVEDAIANLRSAVQLNPYQSSYWLDLA